MSKPDPWKEDEIIEEIYINEEDLDENLEKLPNTVRRMTKYELSRLIGTRADQIRLNAPILIDPKGEIDPIKIALMELKQRRMPLDIIRKFPSGKEIKIDPNTLLNIDEIVKIS